MNKILTLIVLVLFLTQSLAYTATPTEQLFFDGQSTNCNTLTKSESILFDLNTDPFEQILLDATNKSKGICKNIEEDFATGMCMFKQFAKEINFFNYNETGIQPTGIAKICGIQFDENTSTKEIIHQITPENLNTGFCPIKNIINSNAADIQPSITILDANMDMNQINYSFEITCKTKRQRVGETIFSGGDGSTSNPYIITTCDQQSKKSYLTGNYFKNINYNDTSGDCSNYNPHTTITGLCDANITYQDHTTICNCEQLNIIRNNLSDKYILGQDINCNNTSTWNAGKGFEPIGNKTKSFSGTLNGNNYTISNLTIKHGPVHSGLIGRAENATIINNTITNSDIDLSHYVVLSSGPVYASGQLIGGALNSKIENNTTDKRMIGGSVGHITRLNITISEIPVKITNCLELQAINDNLNKNYELTNNIDCNNTTNWDNNKGFKPIGSASQPFEKRFNGNGYEIKNLFINRPRESKVGLFGYVKRASIQKVGLVGHNITGNGAVGGIVGYNHVGTITNTYANGNIKGNHTRVGGIIGMNNQGKIINNYTAGTVSGLSAGGIIGQHYGGSMKYNYSTSKVHGIGYYRGAIADSVYLNAERYGNYYDINSTNQTSCYYDTLSKLPSNYLCTQTNNITNYYGPNGIPFTKMGWSTQIWEPQINGYPTLKQEEPNDQNLPPDTNNNQIFNCEDLQAMQNDLNKNYTLEKDIDCSVTSTWSNKGFQPIGNNNYPFTGNFDGQGHTISNLYINRPNESYVGLFGASDYYSNSTISNLGMIDSNIIGQSQVGGISGQGGMITNCYNTGTITGIGNTGGLAGLHGMITNSYNTGTITGNTSTGGISGQGGITSNSYNTGTISGDYYTGGLTGVSPFEINNSYNVGIIDGEIFFGGLTPASHNTITNSYWDTYLTNQSACDMTALNSNCKPTNNEENLYYGENGIPFNNLDFNITIWEPQPNGHPKLVWEN